MLLKNNGVLPLDKSKKIALIGPNADRCILGGYSSHPRQLVTPRQAFSSALGSNLLYSEGVRLTDKGDWFNDPTILSTSASNAPRIKEAMQIARQADVIVLCLGGNEAIHREAWAPGHLGDLAKLELLGDQSALIDSLKKLNKPMVITIFSGPPLALTNLRDKADALVQCFYLGQETGQALFDVLTGNVNPSGKLSISMPRSAGHLPCYYAYKPSGRRGYLFDSIQPLYPFGYGLSYSQFQISKPTLSKTVMRLADTTFVSTTVTNTGKYAGAEVVQLYIRDDVSSVTRPVKELRGFAKVFLKPGESATVRLPITERELSFYNEELKKVVEPGTFTLMIGNSSQNTQNTQLRFE